MARPCNNDNRIKFTTTLDEDLIKDIKIKAINQKRNVNDILEYVMEKYLEGKI